jgi:hypothetical protein
MLHAATRAAPRHRIAGATLSQRLLAPARAAVDADDADDADDDEDLLRCHEPDIRATSSNGHARDAGPDSVPLSCSELRR